MQLRSLVALRLFGYGCGDDTPATILKETVGWLRWTAASVALAGLVMIRLS